uniref:Uncharacterized protein n=1 Tax=Arcella intermedia TaxID=1963864 RepID=A0A6B2LE93_9EUKA
MLDILDTAQYEEFTSLRDQYMRTSQSFIILFSIDSRTSFDSLRDYRETIMRVRDQEKFPVVLCGNKSDLEGDRLVTDWEAEELARSWGCPYVKTSAKTRLNVDEVFFEIVREIKKEQALLGAGKKGKKKEVKKEKKVKKEEVEEKEESKNLGCARAKKESGEEKKLRKKAVKEDRQVKREKKKELKMMYREETIKERTRQATGTLENRTILHL